MAFTERMRTARVTATAVRGAQGLQSHAAMRCVLVVAVLLSASSWAEARLDGNTVVVERPTGPLRFFSGCTAVSIVEHVRLHVACQDGRIRSYELSDDGALLVNELQLDGQAPTLFVEQGRLWVRLGARVERLFPEQVSDDAPEPPRVEPPRAPPVPPTITRPVRFFPQRPSGVLRGRLGVSGFMPVSGGIGGLFDAVAAWHAPFPFLLEARVSPVAGVTSTGLNSDVVGFAAFRLDAHFDSRFIGLGLGVGIVARSLTMSPGTMPTPFARPRESPAFLFSQTARLGAFDGLHLTLSAVLASSSAGFDVFALEARTGVPLAQGWTLELRLAGFDHVMGRSRLDWFDAGLRIALRDEDTLFLIPTVGVAGTPWTLGPVVGIGVELRR